MDADFASRLGLVIYGGGIVAMSLMVRRHLYGKREDYFNSDAGAQAKALARARVLVYLLIAAWIVSVPLVMALSGPAAMQSMPQLMIATAGVTAAIAFGAIPPMRLPAVDERDLD